MPIFDICVGAEPPQDISVRIHNRIRPREKQPVGPIMPPEAEFGRERRLGVDRFSPDGHQALLIVRVYPVEPAGAQQRPCRRAGVVGPLLTEKIAGTGRITGPDKLRQGVGHLLPALLACRQNLDGFALRRNIGDARHDKFSVADRQRGEAHGNRKPRPVFPRRLQILAAAHIAWPVIVIFT